MDDGGFVGGGFCVLFKTTSSDDANVLCAKCLLIAHLLFIMSGDTTLKLLKREKKIKPHQKAVPDADFLNRDVFSHLSLSDGK